MIRIILEELKQVYKTNEPANFVKYMRIRCVNDIQLPLERLT